MQEKQSKYSSATLTVQCYKFCVAFMYFLNRVIFSEFSAMLLFP